MPLLRPRFGTGETWATAVEAHYRASAVGRRRGREVPRLDQAVELLFLTKQVGCTWAEAFEGPVKPHGSKRLGWGLEFERKNGVALARLRVGDTILVGLDHHPTRVAGVDGAILPPNWYHWDLSSPFPAGRYGVGEVPRSAVDADRLAYKLITEYLNVEFEPDAQLDLLRQP